MSDETKPQIKSVTVAEHERYENGPFDFGNTCEAGTLDRVIASLQAIRESIPEPHRSSAWCEIDSAGGYEGSQSPKIEVGYDRLETMDEARERVERRNQQIAAAEAQQRAEYERLRAKFGGIDA